MKAEFFIVCGNPVAASRARRMRDRLECPTKHVAEEIKAAYKTQLPQRNEAGSKGAGLAF